jgi:hypothetical protein
LALLALLTLLTLLRLLSLTLAVGLLGLALPIRLLGLLTLLRLTLILGFSIVLTGGAVLLGQFLTGLINILQSLFELRLTLGLFAGLGELLGGLIQRLLGCLRIARLKRIGGLLEIFGQFRVSLGQIVGGLLKRIGQGLLFGLIARRILAGLTERLSGFVILAPFQRVSQ